jgi:opacity protein-like surface antigen
MKKILLGVVGVAMLWATASAQTKTVFGIKAGINTSVFTKQLDGFGEGPQSYYNGFHKYPRFSINAGFTADVNISPKFVFGTELIYNGLGSAYRVKNDAVVITTNRGNTQDAYDYMKFRLNYLELPLLAKYVFSNKPNRTSYNLYGGFAPAFNISKGIRYTYYDLDTDRPSNVPVKNQDNEIENVKSFNVSGVLGMQIGTAPASKGFYMDIRLQQTLTSVFNAGAQLARNPGMFTGSFGFGYRL